MNKKRSRADLKLAGLGLALVLVVAVGVGVARRGEGSGEQGRMGIPAAVSQSDEVRVMEKELEETAVEFPENEFEEMEFSAASL